MLALLAVGARAVACLARLAADLAGLTVLAQRLLAFFFLVFAFRTVLAGVLLQICAGLAVRDDLGAIRWRR